jgi:hypothetical protein
MCASRFFLLGAGCWCMYGRDLACFMVGSVCGRSPGSLRGVQRVSWIELGVATYSACLADAVVVVERSSSTQVCRSPDACIGRPPGAHFNRQASRPSPCLVHLDRMPETGGFQSSHRADIGRPGRWLTFGLRLPDASPLLVCHQISHERLGNPFSYCYE